MDRQGLVRNVVLVCFVALIAAAAVASAAFRLTDDSPEAGAVRRGRWHNVTYPLTLRLQTAGGIEEVPVYAFAGDFDRPDVVAIRTPDTGILVDGATGQVLEAGDAGSGNGGDALVHALRRGIRYEPFHPASAPWPYVDRRPLLGEAFAAPEPLSGIEASSIADSVCGTGDLYHNWRSLLIVCPGDGAGVRYVCDVHQADVKAFSRLLAQYVLYRELLRPVAPGDERPDCRLAP